jgi:Zn-dependent protease
MDIMKCRRCRRNKPYLYGKLCESCFEEELLDIAPAFRRGMAPGMKKMDRLMAWKDKFRYLLSVPLKFDRSFTLVFAAIVLVNLFTGGLSGAFWIALAIAGVFSLVILHEYGHVWAAQRCGIAVDRVVVLPVGGMAMMTSNPSNPWDEFKIAIAGPLVNFFLAAVSLGLILLFPAETLVLPFLFSVNLILGIFNLVPAFPTDGGRIFRSILWKVLGSLARSTKIAVRTGQVIGALMVPVGLYIGSILLPFIGIMLIWLAEGELKAVRQRLSGI